VVLLLKNLLFTFVVPGTVAVYVPLWIADGPVSTGLARLPGAVLLALGGAIYAWCVWDFATFGRGTPAPIDAPVKLVVRGLYHYVRNPMYVGVSTVILGWAALYGSARLLLYAAGVASVFHAFVVLYEERHLRAEFGDEYEAYTRRVGRWLPRLRSA
jgi:protein-S-isoprenylcysteine O-methyltransferase Ste14